MTKMIIDGRFCRSVMRCWWQSVRCGWTYKRFLVGKPPNDTDYVVSGVPKDVIETVLKRFGKVKSIGFGVFILNGVEITMTRRGDIPDETISINQDLIRRDATINAMAFRVYSTTFEIKREDIIDDHGGILDIENRIYRFIGDPNRKVEEDPIRALRAVCICGELEGFVIELNSLEAITSRKAMIYEYFLNNQSRSFCYVSRILKRDNWKEALFILGILDEKFCDVDEFWPRAALVLRPERGTFCIDNLKLDREDRKKLLCLRNKQGEWFDKYNGFLSKTEIQR